MNESESGDQRWTEDVSDDHHFSSTRMVTVRSGGQRLTRARSAMRQRGSVMTIGSPLKVTANRERQR